MLAVPGMAWGQFTVKLTATNKTVVSTAPSGGTASATFRLATGGKIRFQTSVGGTYDEQAPFDEWLEPESVTEAENYEAKAVQLGDLPSSGVVNQWLSLGGSSSRDWTMTRSVPGTSETDITILIRRIGTTTTLASTKVTLRATVASNAPSVSLTSPANNAVSNPGQLITLQATATDTDGTISKVEFFDGTSLIGPGTASGSTYTRSWTTASIGTHTITAKATDNNSAVTTSASRTIRVNGPPSVSLTAPVSGTSVDKSVNTVLTATASDSDGVSKVEFFDNGIKVGATDTTAPYSVTWTPTTIGSHSLTARATDSLGAVTTSAPSTVTVNSVKLTATNKVVDSTVASGEVASAMFRLATSGKIRFQTTVDGLYDEQAPFDEWLEPESTTEGSHYEVLATWVSGSLPDLGGGFGTWLQLGGVTPIQWGLTRSESGTSESVFKVEIRRIGTSAVLAFTNVTLRATVTPLPNTPPSVSLTSPADNALFNPGQPILLQATATDTDGTISQVEFFDGTVPVGLGTASGSTYTLNNWTTAPIGTHTITAKATDNNDAVTTSTSRTIRVDSPSSVLLTSPADGTSVDKSVNTTLTATASDLDGVSKVEFFDDGVQVGAADITAPYSVTWTPTTIGGHSLTARATDGLGAVTTSAPSTVTVNEVKLTATNKVVDSTVASGSTASATFRLATGGKIRFQTSVDGLYVEQSPFDEWLEPESITETGNYEALATPVSGTVSAGTVNQWLRLSGDIPTDWVLTNATDDTTEQAVFTLQIRRAGTSTVLASTNVMLRATVAPNVPPSVSLTGPLDGGSVDKSIGVELTATASDTDGVSKVEFFDDGIQVGAADITAPYSVTWTPTTIGGHSLTARATDSLGAVTTSAPSTVTVNEVKLTATNKTVDSTVASGSIASATFRLATGGKIRFQTSVDGLYVEQSPFDEWLEPESITETGNYEALATPVSGTVSTGTVNQWLRLSGDIPTDWVLTNATDDTTEQAVFTLQIRRVGTAAVLASTNVTLSAAVAPASSNPPSVVLTAPEDGSSFGFGKLIQLTADASDSDGTISLVEFYSDDVLLGSSVTSPYSYDWNDAPVGTHSVTAKAYDNTNASTVSAPRSIIVRPLPVITLTTENKVVVSTVDAPDTASATFRFAQGGKIRFQTVVGGTYDEQTPLNEWMDPENIDDATSYEVSAVQVSGDVPVGEMQTWLPMTMARDWTLTRSVEGTSQAVITVSIRRIGNATTLASTDVTLQATVRSNSEPAVEVMYFHHANAQGSIIATTDASGQLVSGVHYRPFGKQVVTAGSAPTTRLGFTGKWHDNELDLDYFGARYYDPLLSRFVSIDPADFSQDDLQSFNRYVYANNNPYKFNDPDGRIANFLVKAAVDFGLEVAIQFATTGDVDLSAAAVETAKGLINPLKTLERAKDLRRAINVISNAKDGARREAKVTARLRSQNPDARVQTQRDLRTADGKRAIDPVTGEGRRVDQAVIQDGRATTFETTSTTANKTRQLDKEGRILDEGGTFIRDKDTRELVPVNGRSEVIREQ
jgi:RHS repeat-associated protein